MAEVNVAWEIETNYLLSYITRTLTGKIVTKLKLRNTYLSESFESDVNVTCRPPRPQTRAAVCVSLQHFGTGHD